MLPSVLLAAAFATPLEMTPAPGIRSVFTVVPVTSSGKVTVPWQYAIEVWGDPSYLRNYPWNYGTRSVWKDGQFQPASSVTTAEQIKKLESALELLKKLGPPTADDERLQRELDELKAKDKKPK